MHTFEGRCQCGSVRFTIYPPTLFCAHCHCHFCRRAHGAPVVTWCGVPSDRFDMTNGAADLRWYASSKESRRGFCSVCGTTMLYESTVAPGEVHVARACVDGEIDREPQAHVFFDHRVPWLELGDQLPRLDSTSPELSKYRKIES